MKKFSYDKQILNKDNKTTRPIPQEKEVEVKKGYGKWTELRFPGEGNEANGYPTTDLIVKFSEVAHPEFKRNVNDLIYTHVISLSDAL